VADDLYGLEEDCTYPNLKAYSQLVAEFVTYIERNAHAIPNYGERYRNDERIATSFVESAVNVVIAKRFTKKQQMQWSRCGAHMLLQIRTRTLDGNAPRPIRNMVSRARGKCEPAINSSRSRLNTPHFFLLSSRPAPGRQHHAEAQRSGPSASIAVLPDDGRAIDDFRTPAGARNSSRERTGWFRPRDR
jgi:hypothetical protein